MQRKMSIFEFNHMAVELVSDIDNEEILILIKYRAP